MVEPASEFTDKVALITDGTEGIGLATARRFMREGARVVIAARRRTRCARAGRTARGRRYSGVHGLRHRPA